MSAHAPFPKAASPLSRPSFVADPDPGDPDVDVGPEAALAGPSRPAALAMPSREAQFLVQATDRKGHSVRLYCRAQPGLARMLADVVASRRYPFRSLGDCLRWCAFEGAKRLLIGGGIPSVTAQVELLNEQNAVEIFQQGFAEYFQGLRKVVDGYLEAKAPDEARRVIANARTIMAGMPEGYWRETYLNELHNRYHTLLAPDDPAQVSWTGDDTSGQ